MEIITVFLAASDLRLNEDLIALRDLFRTMNDKYIAKGIYYHLVVFDPLQENESWKDVKLEECRIAFFLFYKQIPKSVQELFGTVYSNFRTTGSPRIYTIFRMDERTISGEEAAFMEHLDKDLQHYYGHYENIDSLKLSVLTHLIMAQSETQSPIELHMHDNQLQMDGQSLFDLDQIPAFAQNQKIRELKALLESKQKQFERLQNPELQKMDSVSSTANSVLPGNGSIPPLPPHAKADSTDHTGPNQTSSQDQSDSSQNHQLAGSLLQEISELEEEIEKEQEQLLQALTSLAGKTGQDNLSSRQRQAMRFWEKGLYDQALAQLDPKEIDSDITKDIAELKAQPHQTFMIHQKMDRHASELLQRIDLLASMPAWSGLESEIESLYERVLLLTRHYGLDRDPLLKAALHLYRIHQPAKALSIAKELYEAYQFVYDPVSNEKMASLLNLLGSLYMETRRYMDAQSAYEECLRLRLDLYTQSANEGKIPSQEQLESLGTTYNNLASLYQRSHLFEEAKEAYEAGYTIYKRLFQSDPLRFGIRYARICSNLADFYHLYDEQARAMDLFEEALVALHDIRRSEELGDHPEDLLEHPADAAKTRMVEQLLYGYLMVWHNYCSYALDQKRYNHADRASLQALRFARALARWNPQRYNINLSRVLHLRASLFSAQDLVEEAEHMWKQAIALQQQLANQDFMAYGSLLAIMQSSMGACCYRHYQMLHQKYRSARVANAHASMSMDDALRYDKQTGWLKAGPLSQHEQTLLFKAENYITDAISSQQRLLSGMNSSSEKPIADCLNMLALIHEAQGKSEDAAWDRIRLQEINQKR